METHPLSEPSSAAPPAAPYADGLTVWEAKERAGRLAIETEEWRQKRLVSEDPDTKADVLDGLVDRRATLVDEAKKRGSVKGSSKCGCGDGRDRGA